MIDELRDSVSVGRWKSTFKFNLFLFRHNVKGQIRYRIRSVRRFDSSAVVFVSPSGKCAASLRIHSFLISSSLTLRTDCLVPCLVIKICCLSLSTRSAYRDTSTVQAVRHPVLKQLIEIEHHMYSCHGESWEEKGIKTTDKFDVNAIVASESSNIFHIILSYDIEELSLICSA